MILISCKDATQSSSIDAGHGVHLPALSQALGMVQQNVGGQDRISSESAIYADCDYRHTFCAYSKQCQRGESTNSVELDSNMHQLAKTLMFRLAWKISLSVLKDWCSMVCSRTRGDGQFNHCIFNHDCESPTILMPSLERSHADRIS